VGEGDVMKLWLAESQQYDVGELLGAGGEGEVRHAVRRSDGQQVAIKRLFAREGQRFYRELGILTGLRHPHVVNLLDFYEMGANRFLVYEFCTGGTLQAGLGSREAASLGWALALGRQMAAALEAMHALGAIHGDVKPANILRQQPEGTPHWKLADFGMATDGNRRTSTLGYTPRYAAPERLNARLVPPSDIYSLGCVLHEWIDENRLGENSQHEDAGLEFRRLADEMRADDPFSRPTATQARERLERLERDVLLHNRLVSDGDAHEPISLGGFSR
jgi:serine/threonine protein kinase